MSTPIESQKAGSDRADWIGLLGRAEAVEVLSLAEALGPLPDHQMIRAPESGSVMVRGRTGGTGTAFNLGEVTATRCSVRLADGREGHAIVQGRDKTHAHRAAILDALLCGAEAAEVTAQVLSPLARSESDRRSTVARKAEATRVDFETLVRGEDL